MKPLTTRDYDYIEARLLSPCSEANEAHDRLMQIGREEEADMLMYRMRQFIDGCREIRATLGPRP